MCLQCVVSGSVKELCHKLAELGWLHRKIRHFIDSKTRDRSQGLVMQVSGVMQASGCGVSGCGRLVGL